MPEKLPPELLTAAPEADKKHEDGWRLMVGRTMAMAALLTTLASVGATIEANLSPTHEDVGFHPTNIEMNDGRHVEQATTLGFYDTIPGTDTEFKLPGIEDTYRVRGTETLATESVSPEVNTQLMEWARAFDVDPMAAEPRGQDAINEAVATVDHLIADGYHVDRIAITGFASDEADSREGENPGFGTVDQNNIQLADKRAEAVKSILQQSLSEHPLGYQETGKDEPSYVVEVEPGQEVTDAKLAGDIEAMADSLGMSTDDLVMQFNRDPKSLPESAQTLLDGLRQDRFVRIEIHASRQVTEIANDSQEAKIVLIPILIPIFRRKRDDTNNPTPVIPPTIPPVPPVVSPMGPPRQKFPHAPREIGDVGPGYSRVASHNKDPNTHNGGHSKGSGGHFAAKVHTTHRGNQARKH